jgi:signal transduction histidine kinase
MDDLLSPGPGEAQPLPGHATDALSNALFLAEASRLLAASLDYETTLATVARLAVPHLGAWCIVDVVEPDGSARRLSIVHPDPAKQPLVRELRAGWPPERDDPLGAPAVMRTRRAEVIPLVDGELLARVARDEENLRLLEELGIGSLMVVPLVARDQVLGAITFVGPSGGSGFSARDLELAEDLAARAALAVDNARLYSAAAESRAAAEAARGAALAAERAKGQFLAVTSHELRTPLNAIIGYTQLMELGIDGPVTDAQRAKLERIRASGKHLVGLVNEILDMARVEAGRMTVRREPGDVAEAVEAARTLVHPQILESGHTLENRCAGAGSAGYVGDADRVRQILVNLLMNACKFTPRGGRIVVSCGVSATPDPRATLAGAGPWTHVDVADTGPGIPPEKVEAIFEAFVQGETEAFTRTQGGSGLGLAISRRLARLMGGDLTLDSPPGEGARFTLWLRGSQDAPVRADAGDGDGAPGMGVVGSLVLERMGAILAGYTSRLRASPDLPATPDTRDAELQNHALNFLSGVTQHMLALETGDATTDMARDSERIQRTILELHGAQRRRLGWTEEQLRRDLAVLREEVLCQVREAAPPEAPLDAALGVLERMMEQAERVTLRAWQDAAEADGGDPAAG